MNLFPLTGKTAIVTGASRGIGEAIAKGFAEAGADLVLVSRKREALEKVAQDVRAGGRKALSIAADIGVSEEIQRAVDTDDGPYVIAGDAVPQYGNLKGAPEEGLRFLMSGVYTDMVAMWKSMELIDDIVDHDIGRVLPGHDNLVFQKARYPQ